MAVPGSAGELARRERVRGEENSELLMPAWQVDCLGGSDRDRAAGERAVLWITAPVLAKWVCGWVDHAANSTRHAGTRALGGGRRVHTGITDITASGTGVAPRYYADKGRFPQA